MKTLITTALLFLGQLAFSQLYIGSKAVVAFPILPDNDLDYSKGVNFNLGYPVSKSFFINANFERHWVVTFKENCRFNFAYVDVTYSPFKWVIKPLVGVGGGLARERFDLPLDSGDMVDDGWLVSTFTGVTSNIGNSKHLLLDFNLSLSCVLLVQSKSLIKASLGIKYVF